MATRKIKSINIVLIRYISLAFLFCFLYGCGSKTNESTANAEKRQYTEQKNPVTVIVLHKGPFRKELVNNGKLVALRKTDLQFRVDEQLEKILFKNGDYVKTGQLLARLTPFTFSQQLGNAEIQMKKSKLEMQNLLIGQGYTTLDSTKIPRNIYEVAYVKSGYAEAFQSVKSSKFNFESSQLIAPFSGVLANIEKKQYDLISARTTFCTLIDDSAFEVKFRVVESEVDDIRLNDEVQLIPFSNHKIYRGRISEINPVIDENGMILVKSQVKNPGGLIDGMNVKVIVEKDMPDQLVVPKSAILLRDNQEVLFKYTKNGVAYWTYVKTLAENTTSYSVIANTDKGALLTPGDTIIISGNLNLAHESRVEIK